MNESDLVNLFDEVSPRLEPNILRSFVKILCHYEEQLIKKTEILPPPRIALQCNGQTIC